MRVLLILKNRAQFTVDMTELTTTRHPLSGALAKMEWTTPGNYRDKLTYIDLAEVAAIVVQDDLADPFDGQDVNSDLTRSVAS